ncbi:M28 family peptidase [Candidatus Bathyarchaeota archaeon]|nr:M28 family peptidase [Candidatus Bathyarchaeota archaeon]
MSPLRVKRASSFLFILLLNFLVISILLPEKVVGIALSIDTASEFLPTKFTKAIESINITEIQNHVRTLSSFGSRVSGYEGNIKASEYIAEKFREYGVQPYGADEDFFEYFNITTPIDYGSYIVFEDGTRIDTYMFWPNLVNPCPYQSPPEGDKLVYIGTGDMAEYENMDVRGKFVLMDFNSRWLFRIALAYGAKGAIFVPSDLSSINRPDAEQKILFIPASFPRLFVFPEDGTKMIHECALNNNREINVFIHANMTWEIRAVRNVVGYIQGTDPELSKEAIVVSAYYDSWSIIPRLSPGATDSLGVAVLLNLAKFLTKNPPSRSIILLATTGHWQSAWGAREYIERHFDEIGTKIVMFISMDLASDSDSLGVYARGASYPFTYPQVMNPRYSWLISKMFQEYLPIIRMTIKDESFGRTFIDGILLTHPPYIQSVPPYDPAASTLYGGGASYYSSWWRSFGLIFDADPFVSACYGSGFTFHTSNAFRLYQRTPYDIYENINFENIYKQAIFIFSSIWGLSNEPKISLYLSPSRVRDDWGYATLIVVPSVYNMVTAYWDPVNATSHPEIWDDIIVRVSTLSGGGVAAAGIPTTGGTGTTGGLIGGGIAVGGIEVVTKINKEGKAIIHGLKPYVPVTVDVFVINRTNGRIEWSTDIGVFQAPGGKMVAMSASQQIKMICIFPCASISIVSVYNPIDFRIIPSIMIYEARSHGPMIRQNFLQFDTDFTAFIRPKVETEILFSMGERFPIAVLNNNTVGYILEQGESMVLGPLEIAENLYYITDSRYNVLRSYQTYTPTMEIYQNFASTDIQTLISANESLKNNLLYGYSYATWASTLMTYSSIMDLIWQVLATLSFFFLISILTVLIIERLVCDYEGPRRILAIVFFFLILQVAIFFLHPGYSIATNAFVSLLSVGTLFIVLPLLAFIVSEALSSAKELKRKIIGLHFAEVSRSGMFAHSFSAGLRLMSKRRFRTVLTMISLCIIITSTTAFVSATTAPLLIRGESGMEPPYEAILLRKMPWSAMPEETYLYIKSFIGEKGMVVPRAWLYAPPHPVGVAGQVAGQTWIIFSPLAKTRIAAFIALSPEEAEMSGIDCFLIDGRWFLKNEIFACILPKSIADRLGSEIGKPVGVNSTINIWGLGLKVIGLIDTEALTKLTDLDGEWITPADITTTQPAAPPHYTGDMVVIIPFELYARLAFPSFIMSVAIKVFDTSIVQDLATELAYKTAFDIFFGLDGKTYSIRSRQLIQVIGLSHLLTPIVIGSLTILSLMLGAVAERRKEIQIYNAVGMSPSHITQMFIIESLSYAAPAVTIGYISGILYTTILIRLGSFPQYLYPNFSSLIILIVLAVEIAMILSAAIYPSLSLSRIAVPSLTRRWKVTKPTGDAWLISLPFTALEEEVDGLLEYFKEYLTGYSLERYGTFYTVSCDCQSEITDKGDVIKRLIAHVRLAPYDLGIEQDACMIGVRKINSEIYTFELNLQRIRGYRDQWITSNMPFIDVIRKQWLMWRALPPSEREKYVKKAKKW